MDDKENIEKSSSKLNSRWLSYGNYKLIIWAWMMNETTLMFSPAEVALSEFYVHASIQIITLIFVGIPLLYSEICIAQYTNCNIISMWNLFPLFRYVGFATLYLIILKSIYLLVLTSWYLEYSFYAAVDPPPWYSCAEFNYTKCMVKSINVSVFQYCLQAESQFSDDCGMKTASNCFYEREIGGNNTEESINCLLPWKTVIASTTISLLIFLLSIKRDKFIQIFVKFLAAYVSIVILMLLCVALSSSGTWYATLNSWNFSKLTFRESTRSMSRGVLSIGTGCGIIIFLSRDAPFRSPVTMTSVSISLLTVFTLIMFSLVTYSGIKMMIYFHGEEQNVIEIGSSLYFVVFACVTEIMNYFDAVPLWGFMWFSSIFLCLFLNLWILHMFLGDLLQEIELARRYKHSSCAIILIVISFLSWPFFCSDLTTVLTDTTELMQTTNNLLFSFSLYWAYGIKNHNIDIIFMIGIKASYFWRICWFLSPIFYAVMLFGKWNNLEVLKNQHSYYIPVLGMRFHVLLLYIILSIYHVSVILGILFQIYFYIRKGDIRDIFLPTADWGPQDKILFKSRKMFMSDIMTSEFLYRQVRVRGYGQIKVDKKPVQRKYHESSSDGVEWSALTSN